MNLPTRMKIGMTPLALFSNDPIETFVLPIPADLDSAWLEVKIHKGGALFPENTVTILRNIKLHLPPGHVEFSRDHHDPSIITKISKPSGIIVWVILLGPAKLIVKGKERCKWIMQEEENKWYQWKP